MTDKEQIIINGIDVSKCIHLDRYFLPNNNTEFKDCALSGLYYGEFEHSCKDNPDCYFKQLAHKTQECEGLKRKVELMMDCVDCKVDEYKKALEEIEEYLDAQQKYFDGEDYHNLLDIINKARGNYEE